MTNRIGAWGRVPILFIPNGDSITFSPVLNGGVAVATTAIAAGATSNTVVKAAPGRLFRVLVTATGTNPLLIYDNASTNSGTVIGALPASPAVGATYDFELPAANGITVGGNSANPGVTVSWS